MCISFPFLYSPVFSGESYPNLLESFTPYGSSHSRMWSVPLESPGSPVGLAEEEGKQKISDFGQQP